MRILRVQLLSSNSDPASVLLSWWLVFQEYKFSCKDWNIAIHCLRILLSILWKDWARNSMSWFHRQVVSWHFTICYTKQFKLPIAAYFAFDTSRNSIKTKCLLCQFLGYTAIIWHWSLHSPSTWYCRYLHSSSDMWHFPSALFSTYLEIESISRHSFWRSNVSTQNRP